MAGTEVCLPALLRIKSWVLDYRWYGGLFTCPALYQVLGSGLKLVRWFVYLPLSVSIPGYRTIPGMVVCLPVLLRI